ncbi:MAG: hypothetical protein RL208_195 [Pseudomonadota bacterium]|jgi:uncharacterized protein YjbI with pentapeptide repeats
MLHLKSFFAKHGKITLSLITSIAFFIFFVWFAWWFSHSKKEQCTAFMLHSFCQTETHFDKGVFIAIIGIMVAIIGICATVYAIIYSTAVNQYNARNTIIANLTDTAIDALRQYKNASLAADVIKMELKPLPQIWQFWSIIKYRSHDSEYSPLTMNITSVCEIDNQTKHRILKFYDGPEKNKKLIHKIISDTVSIPKDEEWIKFYKKLNIRAESVQAIKQIVQAMKNGFYIEEDLKRMQYFDDFLRNKENFVIFLQREYIRRFELNKLWLHGICLTDANFRGGYCNDIQFQGSYLSNIRFQDSSLGGAKFQFTMLFEINFQYIISSLIDFQGSNLSNIKFQNASLIQANFWNTRLCRVNFTYSRLDIANFKSAALEEVCFQCANLNNSNFQGAKFYSVSFQNATLIYANNYYTLLQHIEEHNGIKTEFGFPNFEGVKNIDTATFDDDKEKDKKIKEAIKNHFSLT